MSVAIRTLLLGLWLFEMHHQPLLSLTVGKMYQGRPAIRGQVRNPSFHDWASFSFHCPGAALSLVVGHAFDVLRAVVGCVVQRAGDDSFLADRQLEEK